ncbi:MULTISPECIES: hypothetical protein [Caproicibacterium]|uniref:Uncharacterized protein n=1 Tax=Caproicibacterium argilliputei TaxID=3030016 RepID=A0AA97H106_9FIRM|nr:hypothetical protein [Caproicibacterium argilliputei]WOC32131.1 hypothetical protein PXC00_13190 [Caproicibacterium argilliputei]
MMRTNGIERMRWAKDLIFEKTSGLQELAVGSLHGEPYIRTSDKATVGLYLSVPPNRETGRYDCLFKGYLRTCGGYNTAEQMQALADEMQNIADLLKQLESAKILLTEDELNVFVGELKSIEEQQIPAPQTEQKEDKSI